MKLDLSFKFFFFFNTFIQCYHLDNHYFSASTQILISCVLICFKIFLKFLLSFLLWSQCDLGVCCLMSLLSFLLLISGLILTMIWRPDCSTFQCTIYFALPLHSWTPKHLFHHFLLFSVLCHSLGRHSWFQVLPFSHSSVCPILCFTFFFFRVANNNNHYFSDHVSWNNTNLYGEKMLL